jgi:hypothetical protein
MTHLPFLKFTGKYVEETRGRVAAALPPCRFLLLFVALFAQDRFA